MTINRKQVFELCQLIAPRHGFEPAFVFAVCEQETEKDKSDPDVYRPDVARLEQNFYRKYLVPANLATTTEVLLSASFGIMQMMGQSLRERGYFEWHFNQQTPEYKKLFLSPLSNVAVVKALDDYCNHPDWNIEYGCRHLRMKMDVANGDRLKALGFWNGDTTGKYAHEVMVRLSHIRTEMEQL